MNQTQAVAIATLNSKGIILNERFQSHGKNLRPGSALKPPCVE